MTKRQSRNRACIWLVVSPLAGGTVSVLITFSHEAKSRRESPSQEDIALAAKVIEASNAARSAGRGAVAVEGRMVDQATVRLATRLWEQARHLGLACPSITE